MPDISMSKVLAVLARGPSTVRGLTKRLRRAKSSDVALALRALEVAGKVTPETRRNASGPASIVWSPVANTPTESADATQHADGAGPTAAGPVPGNGARPVEAMPPQAPALASGSSVVRAAVVEVLEGAPDLTPRQVLALEALLSGQTVLDAAAAGGVSDRQVRHWTSKVPAFAVALAEGRKALASHARGQLLGITEKAIGTVDTIMSGTAPAVDRLRAAGLVLKHSLPARQEVEVPTRGPLIWFPPSPRVQFERHGTKPLEVPGPPLLVFPPGTAIALCREDEKRRAEERRLDEAFERDHPETVEAMRAGAPKMAPARPPPLPGPLGDPQAGPTYGVPGAGAVRGGY